MPAAAARRGRVEPLRISRSWPVRYEPSHLSHVQALEPGSNYNSLAPSEHEARFVNTSLVLVPRNKTPLIKARSFAPAPRLLESIPMGIRYNPQGFIREKYLCNESDATVAGRAASSLSVTVATRRLATVEARLYKDQLLCSVAKNKH